MQRQRIATVEVAPDALADRVILVTGAAGGLGSAVARAAADHGAQVLLLGRSTPPLEVLYDQLLADGAARPSIVPFDLAQAGEPAYEELAELVGQEFGRLDGLVHCAGGLDRLSPLAHWRYADWHQLMQVHVNAAFALTRAMLPLLREAADASTIFTSCEIALAPRAHWGAYAVAKVALEALATVLADECGPGRGTRVYAVDPGPLRTRTRIKAFPAEPRERLPEPASVAWAYLHLLGSGAVDLHGQCLELGPLNSA